MAVDWSNVEVRLGRWAGSLRWPRGVRRDPATRTRWPDNDMWFIWAGRGGIRVRDRAYHLEPGVCVWLRRGRTYDYWQDPGQRLGYYYVHFDLIAADGHVLSPTEIDLPAELLHVPDRRFAEATMARVAELARVPPYRGARENAARLLHCLLRDVEMASRGAAGTPAPGPSLQIRNIADYMQAHMDEPLSVPGLARRVGYSRSHFTRVFKAVVGRSPGEYLIALRTNRAAHLLVSSEAPIGEVGRASGFNSPQFFCRAFRQKMGQTPRAYRRRHREHSEPAGR